MKLKTIKLRNVEFMPKQLEPGILYISEKYGTAVHLCACGCGAKIRTPLGPTEWTIKKTEAGPSLWPSIGNWQQTCQSHYIIKGGNIVWCEKWTPAQVFAGRRVEDVRRRVYYDALHAQKGPWSRFWRWMKYILGIK